MEETFLLSSSVCVSESYISMFSLLNIVTDCGTYFLHLFPIMMVPIIMQEYSSTTEATVQCKCHPLIPDHWHLVRHYSSLYHDHLAVKNKPRALIYFIHFRDHNLKVFTSKTSFNPQGCIQKGVLKSEWPVQVSPKYFLSTIGYLPSEQWDFSSNQLFDCYLWMCIVFLCM